MISIRLKHWLHCLNSRIESVEERAQAFGLAESLKMLGAILGLLHSNPIDFLQGEADAGQGLTAEQIDAQIEARQSAKAARDFALADQIRKDLLEAGVVLEDGKGGTTWRRSE
jgi:cysteinyl-tRNA synthetase